MDWKLEKVGNDWPNISVELLFMSCKLISVGFKRQSIGFEVDLSLKSFSFSTSWIVLSALLSSSVSLSLISEFVSRWFEVEKASSYR